MVQRREDLGLSLEAAHALFVPGERAMRDFDCDVSTELRVLSPIGLTHRGQGTDKLRKKAPHQDPRWILMC
jgi:hypothetical protein